MESTIVAIGKTSSLNVLTLKIEKKKNKKKKMKIKNTKKVKDKKKSQKKIHAGQPFALEKDVYILKQDLESTYCLAVGGEESR